MIIAGEIREHNSFTRRYDESRNVHRVFSDIAGHFATSPAILDSRSILTYADVERMSRACAARLRAAGVTSGDVVGVMSGRSAEAVIAWLGILRCGGVYLPLDPGYPADALSFTLGDCRPAVLLHAGQLPANLELPSGLAPMSLSDALAGNEAADQTCPDSDTDAGAAAYIMYTSGSTGRPKGVIVPHRGIVRLVRDQTYMDFAASQVFLHHSPPSFDASTWEVWGALLNGNPLAIYEAERIALPDLAAAIKRYSVTSLWLTAGLFHAIAGRDLAMLHGLRTLIVGGDVVDPRAARRAIDALPECQLVNGYGPTEATTFSCCYRMPKDLPVDRPMPIGRPIAHSGAFVTDGDPLPREVARGEVGELVVTGDGLALGYLAQPGLTAEKFVTAEVGGRATRAYRTGDLARISETGDIEFLGRADRQVKVNGKRIELDEIEHALRRDPRLADAVAVLDGDSAGRKRIVAFLRPASVVANGGGDHLRDTVIADYRGRMPEHMVPSEVHVVPTYPLNANGKVDRAALLATRREAKETRPGLAFEQLSGLERKIAELWRDALDHAEFGLNQNFFDCGGTSLAMVELHSRLETALARKIPITELFAHPTIAGLAAALLNPATPVGSILDAAADRAGRQKAALARLRAAKVGK